MQVTNTKKMVQGAMVASLFGVLSIFNTYLGGMFDIFLCYGMVIPLVWYGYTYSLKDNMIVCIVAMIVITIVGLPFFVISAFSSCLAGLFLGEALRRRAKKEVILVGTFLVMIINNILLYEVFAGILGIDLIAEMETMAQMIMQIAPELQEQLSKEFFISMIPIVLIMMSAFEMYFILLLCQIILVRFQVKFPGSFHIATMRLTKTTGMILVVIMISSFLLKDVVYLKGLYLQYALILTILILQLQGFAYLSWLMIMKGKSRWMILIAVGFFIPFISMIYVIIGLLDIFSDFRKNFMYNNHNNK